MSNVGRRVGFKMSAEMLERHRVLHTKHGMCYTPTYGSWRSMLGRCLNPRYARYESYGGRGIKVCAEWTFFDNFFADMGVRPEGTTIDRIDVNGNYEPGNCRWATLSEQQRNKRPFRILNRKGSPCVDGCECGRHAGRAGAPKGLFAGDKNPMSAASKAARAARA